MGNGVTGHTYTSPVSEFSICIKIFCLLAPTLAWTTNICNGRVMALHSGLCL